MAKLLILILLFSPWLHAQDSNIHISLTDAEEMQAGEAV
jgi:hypothetical protein